jgi:hypothetical protein
MGDVVMSMFAVSLAAARYGESPDILVHSSFSDICHVLRQYGMPVGKILETDLYNPTMDASVSGIDMSRYSMELLRGMYPGYERYHNCCPRWIPDGCHIAAYLAYCGQLWGGFGPEGVEFPKMNIPWSGSGSDVIVYHFGSSSRERRIVPDKCPIPGFMSVCVGTMKDPCPSWVDCDTRGTGLLKVVEFMAGCRAVVGTDSLMTNLSGLMKIPTICFHHSRNTAVSCSRSIYWKNCISLVGEGTFFGIPEKYAKQILGTR